MVGQMRSVCGGPEHTVFLDPEGVAYAGGRGREGQIGRGKKDRLPSRVPMIPDGCAQVACGYYHTDILNRKGRLYTFGSSDLGQTGRRGGPPVVLGMPKLRYVACGANFTVCLGLADDKPNVWVFGANDQGQLGYGHYGTIAKPGRLPNLIATQVACGSDHVMMVGIDGGLYGWGSNQCGQLGLTELGCYPPTRVELEGVTSIHCGGYFTLAVTQNNAIWSTGYNNYGELGLGHNVNRCQFEEVPGLVPAQLSCGMSHTLCIDDQ